MGYRFPAQRFTSANGGPAALLAALVLAAPIPVLAASDIDSEAGRRDGTTVIEGRFSGTVDAPVPAVVAAMCEVELRTELSETLVAQAVVTAGTARAILAAAATEPASSPVSPGGSVPVPLTPDSARELIAAKADTFKGAACPGHSYSLGVLDYPFPLGEGWALYDCWATPEAEPPGAYAYVCEQVAGSAEIHVNRWSFEPRPGGRTRVRSAYAVDMGMRVPDFLIRWKSSSEAEEVLATLERLANAMPDPATAAPLAASADDRPDR